ncbi:glycosyltransferase [Acinetobacter lactucae]|uniref:glycosyltransferase n=2 Tax=Acinetobacter calcoaceticus/baumannii complex TaxID=909768 RepID=UPI0003DF98E5|nr:glycosyltransferase [Acinetobacter lactucae]ETR96552.1 glycosyl transferases group 1 family protein [Acinetobacter lactucae]
MKILIDSSIVSKGGGVQVALSIIENIAADKDFEVVCVVNTEIDKQLSLSVRNNIKHYYIENIEPIYKKFSQGKRISLIEKKHNPDFVFVVFGPAYWKPKATTLQGFALGKMLYEKELNVGVKEKILNFIKKKIFQWTHSYLLVETELVKTKLANYLGYSQEEIFVIGNSYSPNFKKNVLANEGLITKQKNIFQILVPGSYYPHKNLEQIILSLVEIKMSSILKNKIKILFTIPESSPDWKNLLNLAKQHQVDEFIATVGFVPNSRFAELYLQSNAIICASLVESSTAVFPEAFLANRPLLVSDRPFATELCEDAALYFNPLDEKSIANAILELSGNEKLQQLLVENGKKVLLKNYPSAEQKWNLQKKLITHLYSK